MAAVTIKEEKKWLPLFYLRVGWSPKSPHPSGSEALALFLSSPFSLFLAFLWQHFTPPSIVYPWVSPGPLPEEPRVSFCKAWGSLCFNLFKLKNASLWQNFLKSPMLLALWKHCYMKTADCSIMGPRWDVLLFVAPPHGLPGGFSLWGSAGGLSGRTFDFHAGNSLHLPVETLLWKRQGAPREMEMCRMDRGKRNLQNTLRKSKTRCKTGDRKLMMEEDKQDGTVSRKPTPQSHSSSQAR